MFQEKSVNSGFFAFLPLRVSMQRMKPKAKLCNLFGKFRQIHWVLAGRNKPIILERGMFEHRKKNQYHSHFFLI